jgi:dihydrofolate reductase
MMATDTTAPADDAIPIVLVLAAAENGVIGRGNALPWDLPDDLQTFKRATMGRPIIMGRKTFESIGRPLPGRLNIVVTRDAAWQMPGVRAVTSLDEGFSVARGQCLIDAADAIMVIGGADIYRQALPYASRVLLTRVHGEAQGDAYFDLTSLDGWAEIKAQYFDRGERNSHAFTVCEMVPANGALQKKDKGVEK